MLTVSIADYIRPEDGCNRTPAVVRALQAHPGDDLCFRLTPEQWDFYEDGAFEEVCYESNNDGGLKKVLFSLHGRCRVTVDGAGSRFMIHGRLSAFVVDGCEQITLCNLSSDCQRPFYTQGRVCRSTDSEVELEIDRAEFPFRVCDTNFVPYGDCWENALKDMTPLCQEFDGGMESPAPGSPTAMAWIGEGNPNVENLPAQLWRLFASETPEGHLRLVGDFGYAMKPGNWLIMTHEKRLNSFCFIRESVGVTVRDIRLYHSGSMGVIAQNSRDLTLCRFEVVPNREKGRIISTNADATHFVHCSGFLHIQDCVMESMMDDAGNIHGIYTCIDDCGERELTLRLGHFQHQGVLPYRPGDRLRLLERDTLREWGVVTIRQVALAAPYVLRVETEEPVPPACKGGVAEDPDNLPEVLIEGCRTGKNRPRGFLVNTSKKAVVRCNTFYNSCCGVFVAGDPCYWYEAGPITNLTIEDNTFMGCNTLDGGSAVAVGPERLPLFEGIYHGNVRICNNRFVDSNGRVADVRSVTALTMEDNTCDALAPVVHTEQCGQVNGQIW